METNFVKKITHGYVTQHFDLVSGQFVAQEFTAGGDLGEWEDEDSEGLEGEDRTEADKLYVPFTMEQPHEGCELYVLWHKHEYGGTPYIFWHKRAHGPFNEEALLEALGIDNFEPDKDEWIEISPAGSIDDLSNRRFDQAETAS
jgi:hypothetical protein